jgi:hypothetical protein
MDKVVSNSPSQERIPYQVSSLLSSMSIPSSLGHPESSTPIDGHIEDPSTENQIYHGSGKKNINEGRSTYISAQQPALLTGQM